MGMRNVAGVCILQQCSAMFNHATLQPKKGLLKSREENCLSRLSLIFFIINLCLANGPLIFATLSMVYNDIHGSSSLVTAECPMLDNVFEYLSLHALVMNSLLRTVRYFDARRAH